MCIRDRTSGVTDSHGVTGGVYKTRERIHQMCISDRLFLFIESFRYLLIIIDHYHFAVNEFNQFFLFSVFFNKLKS